MPSSPAPKVVVPCYDLQIDALPDSQTHHLATDYCEFRDTSGSSYRAECCQVPWHLGICRGAQL
jgi:hypothetical protein